MIDTLIQHISNETIQNFFSRKISAFKPEQEDLDYVIRENRFENFKQLTTLVPEEFFDYKEI